MKIDREDFGIFNRIKPGDVITYFNTIIQRKITGIFEGFRVCDFYNKEAYECCDGCKGRLIIDKLEKCCRLNSMKHCIIDVKRDFLKEDEFKI
jgi:hypothetical protein